MNKALAFALRRRGRGWHWTDVLTYAYLSFGVLLMFGPVLWLALSSFKTPAALAEFPPTLLPWAPQTVTLPGDTARYPLVTAKGADGATVTMALKRRIGLVAILVDPKDPSKALHVPADSTRPVRRLRLAFENYVDPLKSFDFPRYLWNSVFVTLVATLITLLINSMAAYALAIY
ncbi:MAG: carbohydrate ABC transporter permease, partial [Hyphomicrobiales bacterium]|nr:carbohydrate ABC transporter permease [Hyphomicrobiales bacterium]